MPRLRLAATVTALALLALPTQAATDEQTINQWYAMLVGANAQGLGNMLADNATIRLLDVNMTQTKAEFLATMDDWRTQVAGAGIRHRIEGRDGDTFTVVACYDFAENDILMRETFVIKDGLIADNSQARIATDCNNF